MPNLQRPQSPLRSAHRFQNHHLDIHCFLAYEFELLRIFFHYKRLYPRRYNMHLRNHCMVSLVLKLENNLR